MISIPSITPIDAGAINFLAKKLKTLGFKCKILEFKKGKGNQLKIFMQNLAVNNLIYVMQDILMSSRQEIIKIGQ